MTIHMDEPKSFSLVVKTALDIGIEHCATGTKRMRSDNLLAELAARLGASIHRRRFHDEILTRAYGLAFVNDEKVKYALKLGK